MQEKTVEQQNHMVNLEDAAAEWLTEELQSREDSGEDNTSDYPVAAQRALFVKGVSDTLADNVDYTLRQAVVEYFHGSIFAAQIKKSIIAEAVKRFPNKDAFPEELQVHVSGRLGVVKRFPNKDAFPEGFPDIKGKLVEDKEV